MVKKKTEKQTEKKRKRKRRQKTKDKRQKLEKTETEVKVNSKRKGEKKSDPRETELNEKQNRKNKKKVKKGKKKQTIENEIFLPFSDYLSLALIKNRENDETYFAYEIDGFGSQYFMDDANIPSLLSLPYLGNYYFGSQFGSQYSRSWKKK